MVFSGRRILGPLRKFCLHILLLSLALPLAGQPAETGPSPVFPAERHAELKDELHYAPPEVAVPDEPREPWDFDWNFDWLDGMGPLFNLLALLLVLLPLGYFIFRLLGMVAERRRRGEAAPEAVHISEIEEEKMVMGGVALSLLERAERAGQFDVAIRLLYIRLLKDLNDRNLIQYRKDYSNRDYRLQLGNHPLLADFRAVTEDYERYWYGQYPVDRLSYRLVRTKFDQLAGRLAPLTVSHAE